MLLPGASTGAKVVHASTDAFACAWTRRRHYELHCLMVLEKPGLFGHHVLFSTRIWYVVHNKRRRAPRWKIGWGLPEKHHFVCGVNERRVKSRLEIGACNVPVREHQASGVRRESEPVVSRLGSFFACWRKNARICSNCARKITETGGANPPVALLDICWSAMSPSGNTGD